MIERYSDPEIKKIWTNEEKLKRWQDTELAVIKARTKLGTYPSNVYDLIANTLKNTPIDIKDWLAKEEKTRHDLNAFLLERTQHLERVLHQFFHDSMTSYDTEEAPMSLMLLASVAVVEKACYKLLGILSDKVKRYQFTPMLGKTHGQEAKLQSVGKRFFTWYVKLLVSFLELQKAKENIYFSKLSGAIGNYQGVTPEEEKIALEIMGLKPFKGATQIMPRQLHQPLANALTMIIGSLSQMAMDIRLGARSGNKIFQEYFDKKQMGSSAMPHKKNPIDDENQEGMFILGKNYAQMLRDIMVTWEERSIEQSSVERVAWPDLFHVVMRSFKNMTRVIEKLLIFNDNMLLEIINSKGCYASEDVKEWLMKKGEPYGLTYEDAYRIVQLAAENAHDVSPYRKALRANPPDSLEAAQKLLQIMDEQFRHACNSYDGIDDIIIGCKLTYTPELGISAEEIERWKSILLKIFNRETIESFLEIFSIKYQLRNEHFLFEELK
ncbi:MAG: hypothetical protein A2Y82_05565 [Candidatus Buchananbacteria bacterium RBG_13_36_9]|uniref:Fumarate lyase N-terminal domain-containing protein n=1 Tax=Candidatus Buchananbacteria bacterium RBG_13_36_9 TaxID=1797530 RepID=A0A1G1XQM3_9BACT|nr:MAG: hypothetical protein A2Y82_05565 [Candidatus Buchananbacteria bacterium RBG_13_36_9]